MGQHWDSLQKCEQRTINVPHQMPFVTLKCPMSVPQSDFKGTILYPKTLETGGGSGIRTHGMLTHTTVFETAPFDRSGIPPKDSS